MTRSAPAKVFGRVVALGAQLLEDELGVGQRLGQPSDTNPILGAVAAGAAGVASVSG